MHVIERLINLGMSEREAKVYICLLNKRVANANELQRLSGIPQNKVHATIGSLIRQGYCKERKEERKYIYEIINPRDTIDIPIKKLEDKLKDSIELKKELVDIYSKDVELTEPLEYIEILYGKENIHQHYCQLIREANKEILGFGRPPYTCDEKEKVEEQIRENLAFIARKGVNRWVYEFNSPNYNWIIPGLQQGQKTGAQFRVAESLPLKMMIFDRKTLLIAEEESMVQSDDFIMSIFKHSSMVKGYVTLFEFFWNQSIELDEWIKFHR